MNTNYERFSLQHFAVVRRLKEEQNKQEKKKQKYIYNFKFETISRFVFRSGYFITFYRWKYLQFLFIFLFLNRFI